MMVVLFLCAGKTVLFIPAFFFLFWTQNRAMGRMNGECLTNVNPIKKPSNSFCVWRVHSECRYPAQVKNAGSASGLFVLPCRFWCQVHHLHECRCQNVRTFPSPHSSSLELIHARYLTALPEKMFIAVRVRPSRTSASLVNGASASLPRDELNSVGFEEATSDPSGRDSGRRSIIRGLVQPSSAHSAPSTARGHPRSASTDAPPRTATTAGQARRAAEDASRRAAFRRSNSAVIAAPRGTVAKVSSTHHMARGATAQSGANTVRVLSAKTIEVLDRATALAELNGAASGEVPLTPPQGLERTNRFTFDRCYAGDDPRSSEFGSQETVHQSIGQPGVANVLAGYNTCVMAYGQTGSGKTYTMLGPGLELLSRSQLELELLGERIHQPLQVMSLLEASPHKGLMLRMCSELIRNVDRFNQEHCQRERADAAVARATSVPANLPPVEAAPLPRLSTGSDETEIIDGAADRAHSPSPAPNPSGEGPSGRPRAKVRKPSRASGKHHRSAQREESTSVLFTFEEISIELSFYEIYNEKVYCLLGGSSPTPNADGTKRHRPILALDMPLRVREHSSTGPFVEGLVSEPIRAYADVVRCLELGMRNRRTAMTDHNRHSSRSHAILQLRLVRRCYRATAAIAAADATATRGRQSAARHVKLQQVVTSTMHLVDLAGSERVSSMTHMHAERLHEAADINVSLCTLGKVINFLASKTPAAAGAKAGGATFAPFRDSTLTWLLKDSFGGNTKTTMLATISPDLKDREETLSTLRYCAKASRIVNKPRVNVDTSRVDASYVERILSELEELRGIVRRFHTTDVGSNNLLAAAPTSSLIQGRGPIGSQGTSTEGLPHRTTSTSPTASLRGSRVRVQAPTTSTATSPINDGEGQNRQPTRGRARHRPLPDKGKIAEALKLIAQAVRDSFSGDDDDDDDASVSSVSTEGAPEGHASAAAAANHHHKSVRTHQAVSQPSTPILKQPVLTRGPLLFTPYVSKAESRRLARIYQDVVQDTQSPEQSDESVKAMHCSATPTQEMPSEQSSPVEITAIGIVGGAAGHTPFRVGPLVKPQSHRPPLSPRQPPVGAISASPAQQPQEDHTSDDHTSDDDCSDDESTDDEVEEQQRQEAARHVLELVQLLKARKSEEPADRRAAAMSQSDSPAEGQAVAKGTSTLSLGEVPAPSPVKPLNLASLRLPSQDASPRSTGTPASILSPPCLSVANSPPQTTSISVGGDVMTASSRDRSATVAAEINNSSAIHRVPPARPSLSQRLPLSSLGHNGSSRTVASTQRTDPEGFARPTTVTSHLRAQIKIPSSASNRVLLPVGRSATPTVDPALSPSRRSARVSHGPPNASDSRTSTPRKPSDRSASSGLSGSTVRNPSPGPQPSSNTPRRTPSTTSQHQMKVAAVEESHRTTVTDAHLRLQQRFEQTLGMFSRLNRSK